MLMLLFQVRGATEVGEWLHFDPITLAVLIAGIIGGWYTMKNSTTWHTEWIKKHDAECEEHRKVYNHILTELQISSGRLTEISSHTAHRVERLEALFDKRRDD